MSSVATNPIDELREPIARLLALAGIDASITAVTPCAQGGNNRIFRVATPAGIFAAKQYFRHPNDARDRLAAEFAFLNYARSAAPGATPQPYACDPSSGIALYEFVEGLPLQPGQIDAARVATAIVFFRALNAPQARAAAVLPQASEACFSIGEHCALIAGRIARLREVDPRSDADAEAQRLIGELDARWRELAQQIRADAHGAGLDVDAPLTLARRCVSPSDFGFHNALAEASGEIKFVDFEYAGWDDPAKAAGDFFAQLALPVPQELFGHFVAEIARDFDGADELRVRAELLRPAYQIKWCCIALNVFLPVHLARRRFANHGLDEQALKQAQYAKAKTLFQSVRIPAHGLC